MPRTLFVVNNPDRWPLLITGVEVVSARTYLTDPAYSALRHVKVFNLCRSYSYQSLGYYVSLLAEARGHKPMPRITTIQDIRSQSLARTVSWDLHDLIQKSLNTIQHEQFALSVYFSHNLAKRHDRLARQLFNLFPAPLLRAQFQRTTEGWTMKSVSAISANDLPESHLPSVIEMAGKYFSRNSTHPTRKSPPRYNLAILADPQDPTPPSNPRALERFVREAGRLGFAVDLLDKEDYGRVAEYDALFIRTTTAVDHFTYRFARRAEAEGLVVIDDPQSIVRCTNKVFLAELLARHKILTPHTELVHRDNRTEVLRRLGLPLILKQPDSSFSRGVVKVETEAAYDTAVNELLEESDLLCAQEFLRTDFDWRIGIIDQRPLYACKYYMARNHWQIYNNAVEGGDQSGNAQTFPIETVPRRLVQTALKAANLIGNGLYGVDLKEVDGRYYIIEINDNPSIDAGVEDRVMRNFLYERIMEVFVKRLEAGDRIENL